METFEHDLLDERVNSYQSTFFHMKVESIDLKNMDFAKMSPRDLGVFIHEYIHYIQQITTPYGLAYCLFFVKEFVLFRQYINENENIVLPIKIENYFERISDLENLSSIIGTANYNKGSVGEVHVSIDDIKKAQLNRTAVNVSVYDFELNRILENGFDFGYTCVIESMAHMIQSFINPELFHNKVPYEAVELISKMYYPEILENKKLLISVCYTALFFDNPGAAFFTIINYAKENPQVNGQEIFKVFMRDFPRMYKEEEMPAYRMMHKIIDKFIMYLQAVIGTDLVYYKRVLDNCKLEASSGESKLLEIIFNGDISQKKEIDSLINFYGIPCIDSSSIEPIIPGEHAFLETATFISFELLIKRFKEKDGQKRCVRFERCERFPRDEQKTSKECHLNQWEKTEKCLFTNGISYWRWGDKNFISE